MSVYRYPYTYEEFICKKNDNSILFIFKEIFFWLRIPSNINQTEVGLFWLSNNNLNRSFTKLKFIECRAERLIAFAIIPRYEKTQFFNRRGSDYTLSRDNWEYFMTIVWHQSTARESIRRRLVSYSSRSTLMTHTDRSSCTASSQTHLSSLQRSYQVGTLLRCQVWSLPRVIFVSAGLS